MKKSIIKKTASFLMACAVAASMAAPMAFAVEEVEIEQNSGEFIVRDPYANAADGKFKITIKGGKGFTFDDNDVTNQFTAYQLFSGRILVDEGRTKILTMDEYVESITKREAGDGEPTYTSWEELRAAIDDGIYKKRTIAQFEKEYEEEIAEFKKDDKIQGLYKLKWGSGFGDDVTTDANEDGIVDAVYDFLTELTTSTAGVLKADTNANVFAGVKTAQELATVLVKYKDDDALLKEFSIIAQKYMVEDTGTTGHKVANDDTQYVIEDLDPGYYLIKDESVLNGDPKNYSKSLPIIEIAGDLTVYLKSALPSLDKSITGATNGLYDSKNADVGIGSRVDFELKVQLPKNYNKYDTYYLSLSDTLPEGLTLDKESLELYAIKDLNPSTAKTVLAIDDNDWTEWDRTAWGDTFQPEGAEDRIYREFTDVSGKTNLKVTIPNLKHFDGTDNEFIDRESYIILKYSAIVNAKATAEEDLVNQAEIEFSNNPNNSKYGKMDPPGGETPPPPGEEPEDPDDTDKRQSQAKVSVFELDMDKNDGDTSESVHKHLDGAEFEITDGDKTAMFYDAGSGKYTFVAWLEEGQTPEDWADDADNQEILEAIFGAGYDADKLTTKVVTAEVENGADNCNKSLLLKGLAPGSYTFSETTPPEGYQPVDDFTVTLEPEVQWVVKYKTSANTDALSETLTGSFAEFEKYVAQEITKVTVNGTEYDITSYPGENDFTYTGVLYYSAETVSGMLVYADDSTKVVDNDENLAVKLDENNAHIAQLNVIDDPTNGLPSTGGAGAYFYYISGSLFALAGIGTLLVSRKKSVNKA